MIDYILQLMDEIEKCKPQSDSHEVNGRYVFPERWILLRRRLLQIKVEAEMKVIFVCKEYFETEDEKVYFFEPLEKEISVEDMQKIVDANEKLVKELKDGTNTISR